MREVPDPCLYECLDDECVEFVLMCPAPSTRCLKVKVHCMGEECIANCI